MTRDEFRNAVFDRDEHTCVFCDLPAADAHHIIERRLWSDGGYHLENGASVCPAHHMACERTDISVEDVRVACNITKIVLPDDMYPDHSYDKWGNGILSDGRRTPGPLFYDESVQKVLSHKLHLFTNYVKYPRTWHLPWSPGATDDDRVLGDVSHFEGKRVVVTEKMDGENTSMYRDYIHARSIDSRSKESQDWVRNFWSGFSHEIPDGWRVCAENLFAVHSIEYSELETLCYGFSVWNIRTCLSWDETAEWLQLLGIAPVRVLYDGIFDEKTIRTLFVDDGTTEGYVVRLASEFDYSQFSKSVAKFVRKDHVKTSKHWTKERLRRNGTLNRGAGYV